MHSNVAPIQKNRDDKSHRVIVALVTNLSIIFQITKSQTNSKVTTGFEYGPVICEELVDDSCFEQISALVCTETKTMCTEIQRVWQMLWLVFHHSKKEQETSGEGRAGDAGGRGERMRLNMNNRRRE